MRFNPDAVPDVGEVTSPPYDVMDRTMVDDLLNENPHNIVRLIVPRMTNDPVGSANPYAKAAKQLRRWRANNILTTDPEPALYVYEYGDEHHHVCGVVGALDLRKRTTRVIVPHEGVIPDIVADRLAMMTAARANLEPILLIYDGAGSTSGVLARARAGQPLTDVGASDGTFHRLWSITDQESLEQMRDLLEPHHALIADGHHRFATYVQLRRRHRSIGDGPGPWDRGLALLIDQSEFPVRLGAIHRSVSELALADVHPTPGFGFGPVEDVQQSLEPPTASRQLVVTDGSQRVRIELTTPPDEAAVSDAELLHERLLPSWGVSEDRLGYHHTLKQTLRAAEQEGGLAILMHPSTVAEVMAVTAAGKIMPRKSTSFGPKPRMGLVMRSFADEL